jgi:hypothetical protein
MTFVPSRLRRLAPTAIAVLALVAAAAPAAAAPPAGKESHGNPQGNPHGNPTQPPGHGPEQTDQGVVQSVSGSTVMIRALDGSTLNVPIGTSTRVLVDGRLASLGDVKPGDVAVVEWKGDSTRRFEAFDLSPARNERLAVVKSTSTNTVVVSGANGGSLSIHANVRTRIFLDGKASSLRSVHPGFTLVLGSTPAHGKPAAELVFLSSS